MINPTLIRKEETVLPVSEYSKRLFRVIYTEKQPQEEDEEQKIKVSSLISKMAFYYEKIRNSVDYKEEHLLRKNAILRILKRQIVIEGSIQEFGSQDVAKHLLSELIRAGYLPNDQMPVTVIDEAAKVIDKYLKMKKFGVPLFKGDDFKERRKFVNWILAMAACEIEERLGRGKVSQVIVENIYEILSNAVTLPDDSPYKNDKDIQIYINIHRNLLKYDQDMVGFILLKYYNEGWADADEEKIMKAGNNIKILLNSINSQIEHPLAGQLNRVISPYTVYFTILRDVIEDNPVNVYNNFKDDPKAFPRDIKKVCKKRYGEARSRLWRAAIRSIIYIFITKSVFAAALEIPATQLFGEPLNTMSLFINITFPAALLFIIVLFTKLPSDENTDKIVEGINRIVFRGYKEQEPIRLREPVKRTGVLNTIFGFIYFIMYFVSFGLVVWGLNKIGFNFVSITIFLFFLAFVSFFAVRIRRVAHEYIIVERKENLWAFLADFFYIPIVKVGKWLSEKFSRINVFVFILDFIIEAPFKIFVEIAEEWTKYVKERRDEIV